MLHWVSRYSTTCGFARNGGMADGAGTAGAPLVLGLDIALLAPHVHVDQSEGRAAVFGRRFYRHQMLAVLGSNFQFNNAAGVVTFALDRCGAVGIVFAGIHMNVPAVFVGVAFENLAVFLQLIAIVSDDLVG